MNEKTLSASPTRVASYPTTSPDNAQIQSRPQASARRRQNRATTQPNPEPVYDDSVFNTHNDARRAQSEPQKGVLRRMTTGLFTPERKVGKAPSFLASFKAAILSSWINILLVFIPIGWALHFVKDGGNGKITDTAVFVTTFISIMPLAGLLGFATEEAALRMGETLGGLLNATLGNAVELIVAILALIKCELAVVQSSLVGSILSNILLVLGMCFFAGGLRYAEQTMKSTAAQLNSSLLLIAVIAVLIPSAFHFAIQTGSDGQPALSSQTEGDDLLAMSHAVAILLLVLYLGYLIFQMWSHATLFNDDDMGPQSTRYGPEITGVKDKVKNYRFKRNRHRGGTDKSKVEDEEGGMMPVSTTTTPTTGSNTTRGDMTGSPEMMPTDLAPESSSATSGATTAHQQLQGGRTKEFNDGPVQIPTGPRGARAADEESEEEEEEPQMNIWATMIVLIVVTVLVGVTAEFLVSSINGLVESNPSLSAEWVGLILLPIVGNAAEHFTAVSVSVKDKLDLSISVAVGSSIQVALFVIPVIQLLAWTIGKPMTLLFDPYEVIVLFLSVLVVNQTLADGRSNWMEGLVLMLLYLIIAVSFWYYPGSDTATLLGC